jgi:hypothetical protein
MTELRKGMLVVNKNVVGSTVYVVLSFGNTHAQVQSKDSGKVYWKKITELVQATQEQYKLYNYDYATANGIQELTPYELTNFLIWVRSGFRISGNVLTELTDGQLYVLASEYLKFKDGRS